MSANSEPSGAYAAVTPNDSTNLPGGVCRALYVGTGGTVVVQSEGNATSVTFSSVPSGMILPIRAVKVMTASTATNIVALY